MDKTPFAQAYKESGKPRPVVIFQKAAWQGGQSELWKAAWLLTLRSSARVSNSRCHFRHVYNRPSNGLQRIFAMSEGDDACEGDGTLKSFHKC